MTKESASPEHSDQDNAPRKRKKVSRACDRCNKFHQPCKLDLEDPDPSTRQTCIPCKQAGVTCTFDRPVKKRGPQTGYTGQHGERLWGLVFKAKPELEDIVYDILTNGTYGNTGVSNVEYFRNSANQSELVSSFAGSKVARLLKLGQSGPGTGPAGPGSGQDSPTQNGETHLAGANSTPPVPSRAGRPPSISRTPVESHNPFAAGSPGGFNATRSLLGGPQNPYDYYGASPATQPLTFDFNQSQLPTQPQPQTLSQPPAPHQSGLDWSTQSTSFLQPNKNFRGFGQGLNANAPQTPLAESSQVAGENTSLSSAFGVDQGPPGGLYEGMEDESLPDFGEDDLRRLYESLPMDTLLNLGFAPTETMSQDFLDMSMNPDPLELSMGLPSTQGEDEASVWRRLVMRGKFN